MKNSISERGQGLVEWALIGLLILIVVVVAVSVLGPCIEMVFDTVNQVNGTLGGH